MGRKNSLGPSTPNTKLSLKALQKKKRELEEKQRAQEKQRAAESQKITSELENAKNTDNTQENIPNKESTQSSNEKTTVKLPITPGSPPTLVKQQKITDKEENTGTKNTANKNKNVKITSDLNEDDEDEEGDGTGEVKGNNEDLDHTVRYIANLTPQIITMLVNYDIPSGAMKAVKNLKRNQVGNDTPFNSLVKIMTKMQETIGTFQKEIELKNNEINYLKQQNHDQTDINLLLRDKIATMATVHEEMNELHKMIKQRELNLQENQKHIEDLIKEAVSYEMGKIQVHQLSPYQPTSDTPTYAKVAAATTFKQNKDTAIMLVPMKDQKLEEIQKQLRQLAHPSELGVIKCTRSRTGKLFVQCTNENKLKNLREKIETNSILQKTVKINNLQEKRRKIIIYGAPHTTIQYIKKPNEEIPVEAQEYLNIEIIPGMQKYVEDTKTVHIHKIIKGQRDSILVVLDLLDYEAKAITSRKTIQLGFHNCLVKYFVTIQRCFNCSRIGHLSTQCDSIIICAYCTKDHLTQDCPTKDNPKSFQCINCLEHNYTLTAKDFKNYGLPTNHFTFDRCCGSYKYYFNIAMKDNDKRANIMNIQ